MWLPKQLLVPTDFRSMEVNGDQKPFGWWENFHFWVNYNLKVSYQPISWAGCFDTFWCLFDKTSCDIVRCRNYA